MKLLIVSHTPHYHRDGRLAGWGPTVREIDHLSRMFEAVVHVAPVHEGPTPASSLDYESSRVRVRPVRPSGGERWRDKPGILARAPEYIRAVLDELRSADVVHVRCPANISLLTTVLLAFVGRPRIRWIKYAGDWRPAGRQPWSYSFQRWWLRKGLHRAIVTVNGSWPGEPAHVHSFLNPCLTDEELAYGRGCADQKALLPPIRLLYAGRLDAAKGADKAIRILSLLGQRGVPAILDIAGDGPERPALERSITGLGLRAEVCFHGWVPRPALAPLYACAHVLLCPSRSEGWPKVLSEAMAHGAVPVAGRAGSISQVLARISAGRVLDPGDIHGFAEAVAWYAEHPADWKEESARSVRAAEHFGYTRFLEAVQRLLAVPPVVSGVALET